MGYASWSVSFGEQPSAAKWNILGTNDASFNDGTGIGAGAILPNNLIASASTLNTWAWDTWTPTWTNLTIGNAVTIYRYMKIGKTVFVQMKVTFGNTSSMGTGPRFTLPVPENTTTYPALTNNYIGDFLIEDSGTANYTGTVLIGGSGKAYLYVKAVSGAYVIAASNITSTAPMTWTTNDFITLAFAYEAA